MSGTERLYYTDSYLREFQARVLKVEPAPKGCRVILDRTAFYPESGGQPSDRGALAGCDVLDVVDHEDVVVHLVAQAPVGESVKGTIDWLRRFDHMQQHTGQHVLSAAFEKLGGYKTVSFHLGAEVSTIDLDSDRLGARQIEDAENLANQVIFENREVRIFFRPASEASQMDLRKPTFREGDVRLVEVSDFDLSACGGTHVSRTGAIGVILARKFERLKGSTRIEFICGGRALRGAREDFRILSDAARLFSAAPARLPELIRKQSEDLRAALRAHEKGMERCAELHATQLWEAAPEHNGKRLVRAVFPAEEAREAKFIAHEVAKRPSSVTLIGVKGKPAALFFAQTPGGSLDMGGILKQTVAKCGGKGGGAKDFAQGGGLDETRLEEALNYAATLLGS